MIKNFNHIPFHIAPIKIGKKRRTITLYEEKDIDEQRQLYEKYETVFLAQIDDAVYSYRKGRFICILA